jgi:hypothetical protein
VSRKKALSLPFARKSRLKVMRNITNCNQIAWSGGVKVVELQTLSKKVILRKLIKLKRYAQPNGNSKINKSLFAGAR